MKSDDGRMSQRIEYVRSLLDLFAVGLKRGSFRSHSLEDLGATIDGIRKTVWQILISQADYQTTLAQFRLRRTTEICSAILSDLEAGSLRSDSPEVGRVTATLQDLARAMRVAKSVTPHAMPDGDEAPNQAS